MTSLTKGTHRPRMSDVAGEAGVARVTVSRVLSDPDSVAPATRAVVQAAIERLGFVPNLNAGTLASSRSRIVGAIVPTLSNAWFGATIDGLADTLAAASYQLLLGQSRYNLAEEERLVAAFVGRRVDAILLTGVEHGPGVRTRLQLAGVPTVECWDLCDDPIGTAVGFSNQAAGRAVAEHLLSRGRRRFGFIGANEPRAQKRLQGLREVVLHAGCPDVAVALVHPPSTITDGSTSLTALMAQHPHLDALFCSNDTLAIGALATCRAMSWPVPDRLAVVGFSDQPIAAVCTPTLSSVQVQARAVGEQAGAVLLAQLAGRAPAPRVVDLGFQIQHRGSS